MSVAPSRNDRTAAVNRASGRSTVRRIISQTAASFGKIPMEQMERTRDNRQVALLRALGNAHASGTQKQ